MQAELQQKVDKLAQSNIPAGLAQKQFGSLVNDYKEKVKRGYIFAAPNQSYAYFALFQTLNGYMIFDPMASKDDIKCFQAVATSLNNAYPHADRSRNLYNMVIKGLKNTRQPQQEVMEIDPSIIKEADIIDIQLKDLKGLICHPREHFKSIRRMCGEQGSVLPQGVGLRKPHLFSLLLIF